MQGCLQAGSAVVVLSAVIVMVNGARQCNRLDLEDVP